MCRFELRYSFATHAVQVEKIPPASDTVKPDRDEQRVRQRYLRISEETLVERLITAEQTLAEG